MIHRLLLLLRIPLVRYIFVGGLAYVVELLAIFTLRLFIADELLAVGIAFWVGLVTSFWLQKVIAFKNHERQPRRLLYQSALYGALVVFNYIFTLLFVGLTSDELGVYIARTLALIITTSWNYLAYSRLIFAHQNPAFVKKANHATKQLIRNIPAILLALSVLILLLSSCYVGYKSSIIHSNNHDQLINSYLAATPETLKGSTLPGAHSQLFKLPVFVTTALFGNRAIDFSVATIILYVATVLGLAYAIYRATGRNKITSSFLILLLVNVLALIPVQPFPGALLPVNMAMMTTRNVEYVLFILLLVGLIKTKRIFSPLSLLTLAGLILLGASDKLFATLAVGLGVSMPLLSSIASRTFRPYSKLLTPAAIAAIGYVGATALLLLIDAWGPLSIDNGGGSSPFKIAITPASLIDATKGIIKAFLMNFGAFPGPSVSGWGYAPYVVNGLVLLAAGAASLAAVYTWVRRAYQKKPIDTALALSVWLIAATAMTVVMFMITDHYYRVDARYIGVWLFAGFVAIAYMSRYISLAKLQTTKQLIIWGVLAVLVALTVLSAKSSLDYSIFATNQNIGNRLDTAAAALVENNIPVVVGDFWFTVPLTLKTDNQVLAVPQRTDICDKPNPIFNSSEWLHPDEEAETSALYILRDPGEAATTFNHGCTIEYLDKKYGKPDKEIIISGTPERPTDILRFYSYDIRALARD